MGAVAWLSVCKEGSKSILAFPVVRNGYFRGPGAKLSIFETQVGCKTMEIISHIL